jgi:hypothetical protein
MRRAAEKRGGFVGREPRCFEHLRLHWSAAVRAAGELKGDCSRPPLVMVRSSRCSDQGRIWSAGKWWNVAGPARTCSTGFVPSPPEWWYREAVSHSGSALFVLVVLGMFTDAAGAGPPQMTGAVKPGASAERLTQSLITLDARHRAAAPAERPRLLEELRRVAAERRRLLASLIETRPGEVLRVALPAALRESLPADVRLLIEERGELEGVLTLLVEDPGRYLYWLDVAGAKISLHFAADPAELLTGTRVRVRGARIDGALALASGRASVEILTQR